MTSRISSRRFGRLLPIILVATVSTVALADPPTRVARLSYAAGDSSYSPAGENDWVDAPLNRPLTTGDRLWAGAGAQDELQIGSAVLRLGGNTSVTLLNLDDRTAQVQLTQGSLNVHVRRLRQDEVFEIDTPNLAFSLHEPGDYRIDVDADGYATTVAVHRGQGEVIGEGAAYSIGASQSYRFAGTGLHEYQALALPPPDEFDRWSSERERRAERSASARYVSPDMIGYEDLDDQGSWRNDRVYGNVWVPFHVAADWAPYHDGHWSWVEPWGWTWVDNAPWGFAVSHYGRWVNQDDRWAWVPGPIAAQPVYAPALVAFVGGNGFRVAISGGNVAGVAWFPLAPQDVYRPAYKVSLNYFAGVNSGNAEVNRTNITNVYNNTNVTNITYVNRAVPGAVIAVTATAFTQSQPVSRSAIKLNTGEIGNARIAPVAMAAPVAPVAVSVRGAAVAGHAPPAAALTRQVVVNTAPPAAPVPFAARQPAMASNPGRPLDSAQLAKIAPAAPVQAAPIKLAHPPQAAAPINKAPPSIAVPQNADQAPKQPVAPAKEATQVAPLMPALPAVPPAPLPHAKPGEPASAAQVKPPFESQLDAKPAPNPPAEPSRETRPAAMAPPHDAKPFPSQPSVPAQDTKLAPMPQPHEQFHGPISVPVPAREPIHEQRAIPAAPSEPVREARPAPVQTSVPQHEPSREQPLVPPHEINTAPPQPQPAREMRPPAPAPAPRPQPGPPPVMHTPVAPAAPAPRPEPGKHEEPRPDRDPNKGPGKNPQDDK